MLPQPFLFPFLRTNMRNADVEVIFCCCCSRGLWHFENQRKNCGSIWIVGYTLITDGLELIKKFLKNCYSFLGQQVAFFECLEVFKFKQSVSRKQKLSELSNQWKIEKVFLEIVKIFVFLFHQKSEHFSPLPSCQYCCLNYIYI